MLQKFIKSLSHAINGIKTTIIDERNMQIHVLATILIVLCMLIFPFKLFEILLLILCIGLVWMAEIINTSIENIVDLVSPEKNPLAKKAKDMAAGAVLIISITAVIIFLLIITDYIL